MILKVCIQSLLVSIMVATSLLQDISGQEGSYAASIQKWRTERETRLKADGGWLTVTGLFWLQEGANQFGTDSINEIVLPKGSTSPKAGVFEYKAGQITARIAPEVRATSDGKSVTTLEMRPDTSGSPTTLSIGSLAMHVIKRGNRYGIRLKDSNSELRRQFKGLRWFPAKESYRVTARFVAYSPPKLIPISNILGTVEELSSPGYVVFTLNGKEYQLDPVLEEPDAKELFFIFRDETSGKETYGSGRFFYAEMPHDGKVILDFNKAYSPPCAFTPYATCPLPPKQNRLPVRIEAGEIDTSHHKAQ